MMKMIAVLAFMAFATALPSTADNIVREGLDASSMAPPTEFVEVSAFDEAQATVNSMIKSGKDEGACADLAAATIKEVEDAVDSQQKVLDSLDTGADCPNKGQGEVDSAESTLDGATKDKEAADAAAAAAAAADINFASRPLSSLTPGQCGVFFSDPAYTSAVAAKEAAAGSASQAAAAVTAAEAGLESAKQAQQDAIKECQCSAKKAYAAAWEAANSNNDANEKAYTKGKHMACVLAGTPPASCNVGAIPTVTAVTLTAAVESAQCEAEHTSQKVTCTMTIDNAVTDVLYNGKHIQHMTGPMTNWNADKVFTFDSVANGVLLVAGYDSEGGNSGHCRTGGFAIQCQSDDSFWGSFSSASSAIQAAGGQNSHGGFNGPFNPWGTPCTSTSGFSLPANRGLKKLWAPNGERWAKFQMGPSFQK